MTYRSDRQLTEELIPVRLFGSILWHGLTNHTDPESIVLLNWVRQAEAAVIAGLDDKHAGKVVRRSWRVNDAVIKPYQNAEAHVAKFGLVAYYVLRRLIEAGATTIVDDTPLDWIQAALLFEDGTLVEFANIERIDTSAQKQARKMFATIQGEGLFREVVWE